MRLFITVSTFTVTNCTSTINDCETLSCESGWKKASIDGDVRCFKSLGAFPFGQIGSVCQQHNAVVPLPRNKREDQDFNTLFKSFGLNYAILGASDLQKEGVWTDMNGNKLTYSNWFIGEPNNDVATPWRSRPGEHYVQWRAYGNGRWNDDGPSDELENYVCERRPICDPNASDDGEETGPTHTITECESGWTKALIAGTEKCLKLVGSYQLKDVFTQCEKFDATIPLPKSEQEDNDLSNFILNVFKTKYAAIGATDRLKEGEWRDKDGNLLTYTNWYSTQPDNAGNGESYVQYRAWGFPQWNDNAGTSYNDFICEKPTVERTVDGRNPNDRLVALQGKALEIADLGGWKTDSPFVERLSKKLKQVSDASNAKRNQLMGKGCEFPRHWDWQDYVESQNKDRYNRDDPCMAVQQIFLSFSRWIEIYTRDCTKPMSKRLKFHSHQVRKLNNLRNKMFVSMQCDKYTNKYDLCDEGWIPHTVDGKKKCFYSIGRMPIQQAVESCISRGANLPLPKNNQANIDTYKVVKSFGQTEAALDGSDVEEEGNWVQHSTGKKIKWSDWGGNNPNNAGGRQHYLWYWKAHQGQWDDLQASAWVPVICEKDA